MNGINLTQFLLLVLLASGRNMACA